MSYLVVRPFLTSKDCDIILKATLEQNWIPALVGSKGESEKYYRQKLRSCKVSKLPNQFYPFIAQNVMELSAKEYGEEDLLPNEGDLFTIINYKKGDFFDWHKDKSEDRFPSKTRAITFTIQLTGESEYDGGDLELEGISNKKINELRRKKGWITMFPSETPHRVKEVQSGNRVSLVGWLHHSNC